jgi:hypothetical protein
MTDNHPVPKTSNSAHLAVAPAHHAVLLDQNPTAIYLASLGDSSRRTMRTALNTIAELLGVGEALNGDGRDMRCLAVPWGSLHYAHTAAIHAQLQNRYAPATANKLLVALRRAALLDTNSSSANHSAERSQRHSGELSFAQDNSDTCHPLDTTRRC